MHGKRGNNQQAHAAADYELLRPYRCLKAKMSVASNFLTEYVLKNIT